MEFFRVLCNYAVYVEIISKSDVTVYTTNVRIEKKNIFIILKIIYLGFYTVQNIQVTMSNTYIVLVNGYLVSWFFLSVFWLPAGTLCVHMTKVVHFWQSNWHNVEFDKSFLEKKHLIRLSTQKFVWTIYETHKYVYNLLFKYK